MKPEPFDIANDGNLFPREDLLEAVARSDWRDREVPVAAWLLTGAGIALLAAGTPIANILIRSTTEFAADAAGPLAPFHAALAAIGRAGVGIEAAAFLVSALAVGATVPALGLALKAAGFHGRVAFAAALIAVMSPLLLMHGRLPSDGPVIALGSTLLLASVAAPRDAGLSGRKGYLIRIAVVACLLLAACGWSRAAAALDDEAIFGRGVDLLLLAGAALVVIPLSWFRQEEEAPPPRWLVLWLAVSAALAALAGAQAGAALVPALAVLVANALARRARPDGALRWAGLLAGGQLALTAVAIPLAPADTSLFAASGRGEVEAGDTVIVQDLASDEAYLLRRRLGITVVERAPAEAPGRVMALGGWVAAPLALDPITGQVTAQQRQDRSGAPERR